MAEQSATAAVQEAEAQKTLLDLVLGAVPMVQEEYQAIQEQKLSDGQFKALEASFNQLLAKEQAGGALAQSDTEVLGQYEEAMKGRALITAFAPYDGKAPAEVAAAQLKIHLGEDYASKPTMVMVGRKTCSHCIGQSFDLGVLQAEYGDALNVRALYLDDEQQRATPEHVLASGLVDPEKGVPQLMLVKDGKVVHRFAPGRQEAQPIIDQVTQSFNGKVVGEDLSPELSGFFENSAAMIERKTTAADLKIVGVFGTMADAVITSPNMNHIPMAARMNVLLTTAQAHQVPAVELSALLERHAATIVGADDKTKAGMAARTLLAMPAIAKEPVSEPAVRAMLLPLSADQRAQVIQAIQDSRLNFLGDKTALHKSLLKSAKAASAAPVAVAEAAPVSPPAADVSATPTMPGISIAPAAPAPVAAPAAPVAAPAIVLAPAAVQPAAAPTMTGQAGTMQAIQAAVNAGAEVKIKEALAKMTAEARKEGEITAKAGAVFEGARTALNVGATPAQLTTAFEGIDDTLAEAVTEYSHTAAGEHVDVIKRVASDRALAAVLVPKPAAPQPAAQVAKAPTSTPEVAAAPAAQAPAASLVMVPTAAPDAAVVQVEAAPAVVPPAADGASVTVTPVLVADAVQPVAVAPQAVTPIADPVVAASTTPPAPDVVAPAPAPSSVAVVPPAADGRDAEIAMLKTALATQTQRAEKAETRATAAEAQMKQMQERVAAAESRAAAAEAAAQAAAKSAAATQAVADRLATENSAQTEQIAALQAQVADLKKPRAQGAAAAPAAPAVVAFESNAKAMIDKVMAKLQAMNNSDRWDDQRAGIDGVGRGQFVTTKGSANVWGATKEGIDSALEDGTVTQDEATAIEDTFKQAMQQAKSGGLIKATKDSNGRKTKDVIGDAVPDQVKQDINAMKEKLSGMNVSDARDGAPESGVASRPKDTDKAAGVL